MAGSDQKAGRAPERANIEADEDPLIELARIVSEDGGFAGPRTEKPKVNRNEPAEPNAFTDGLEAELLQELESSFGARDVPATVRRPVPPREAPAPYAPRQVSAPPPQRGVAQAAQRPPRPADERDPEDLLKSIEEQLGQFERRQAERLAVTTASFSSSRREPAPADLEWPAETEPDEAEPASPPEAPTPEESRGSWQRGVVAHLRPLDDDDDAPTAEERWEELAQPDPEPAAHPEYRFRGPANAGWDRTAPEGAGDDTRPLEEPPVRRASRAESFSNEEATDADLFAPAGKVSRARDPFADDADAGDRGKASDSAEAFRGRRRVSPFPEFDEPPVSIAETSLGKNETRLADALEPRYADPSYGGGGGDWKEAAAAAEEPGIATQSSVGRRSAAARTEAAKHGRTRVALLTMLGVVAVVLIGGAGALYLRSTERAPAVAPPVIAADEGPVKVEAAPDPAATESETAGEAVFNRVAGAEPDTAETVVESAEEPREVARIVLPPPQAESNDEVVRPVGDEPPTTQEPASAANEDIGPRLVPTYTVRPDGTIIANNDAGDQPAADQQIAAAAPAAPPAPAASETLSPAAEEAMTPRPTIDEPADIAVIAPAEAAAIPEEPAEPESPVNLLAEAAAPAAASAAPAAADAGFLVQVSSQRSMEQAQASFVDLQQRYTAVLGNLTPDIQQADLGAKGIYYRVRVGPWAAREEAIQVCEALKTAGGDCLVTQ